MAARKTAAPRKAAVSTADPSPRREEIEAFEGLRDRARASGLALKGNRAGPYVLDRGFDPPVEAHWPKSLVVREEFDQAARRMDVFGMLRILLGDHYLRVLAAFDTLPDSEELLLGLHMRIIDHFNGPGAADVPGGTPAS